MKIKYILPDDVKADALAELKEHLAMNGYDAEWLTDRDFIVSEEMAGYVDTILSDRDIDSYNSEPLVKWYDDFEMENKSEGNEEDAYFTFLVGETVENEGEEDCKVSVYMDMRGYLTGVGEPVIYPYDDKKTAYLHDEYGAERSVELPDNIYEQLEKLTEEAVAEEYLSRDYE